MVGSELRLDEQIAVAQSLPESEYDWYREHLWRIATEEQPNGLRKTASHVALARLDPQSENWIRLAETVARSLVETPSRWLMHSIRALEPVADHLKGAACRTRQSQRCGATREQPGGMPPWL